MYSFECWIYSVSSMESEEKKNQKIKKTPAIKSRFVDVSNSYGLKQFSILVVERCGVIAEHHRVWRCICSGRAAHWSSAGWANAGAARRSLELVLWSFSDEVFVTAAGSERRKVNNWKGRRKLTTYPLGVDLPTLSPRGVLPFGREVSQDEVALSHSSSSSWAAE